MDSALQVLSGCQCPVIRNMVTECRNTASRMILKEVSEGSYGSNLIQMDVGSADCLARHDLPITDQVFNRVIPPYLFDPSIPDKLNAPPAALMLSWSPYWSPPPFKEGLDLLK
eukprot:206251-Pelagomonas_calceolata.AAC.1